MTDQERLKTAQWIFERNLAWIASADAKAAFIVAVDTAMLAGLAAAYGSATSQARTAWAILFCSVAVGAIALAIFCTAIAVLPRTTGPKYSVLFFAKIADLKSEDYMAKLATASASELLADWAAQIHRNAQIARDKHSWIAKSMNWSFLAGIPWLGAIFLLVKI